MATKIITKNSSTTTAIPTAGDLVQGELAVNVTDKRLFTENASGAIVELGTAPSTIDINAGTIDGTVIGATTAAAITATGLNVTNSIVVGGTVDGRDVATDGTKLDGIESAATADQTNAEIRTAVEAATDSNVFTDADHTKLNAIEALADVTDTINVTAAGALMDSEVTNLAEVKAFDSTDYATSAQGTTADDALPKAGGAMTGAITTNSTFDGRDVATDGTKLDGIEALADVTDVTNVTAAGALMDSELTSIAAVKALNQGVATTDSPTFVAVTSTNGVYLGGTAAANLLDDYEEGTWTPAISGGVVSTDGGNTYTKVGRLVTILMRFNVTTSSTLNIISGLPFATDTGDSKFQAAGIVITSSGTGLVTARVFSNGSFIYLYDNSSGYTSHPPTTSRSQYTLSFSYTTTA